MPHPALSSPTQRPPDPINRCPPPTAPGLWPSALHGARGAAGGRGSLGRGTEVRAVGGRAVENGVRWRRGTQGRRRSLPREGHPVGRRRDYAGRRRAAADAAPRPEQDATAVRLRGPQGAASGAAPRPPTCHLLRYASEEGVSPMRRAGGMDRGPRVLSGGMAGYRRRRPRGEGETVDGGYRRGTTRPRSPDHPVCPWGRRSHREWNQGRGSQGRGAGVRAAGGDAVGERGEVASRAAGGAGCPFRGRPRRVGGQTTQGGGEQPSTPRLAREQGKKGTEDEERCAAGERTSPVHPQPEYAKTTAPQPMPATAMCGPRAVAEGAEKQTTVLDGPPCLERRRPPPDAGGGAGLSPGRTSGG